MKNFKDSFQLFRPGFPHHVCVKGIDGFIIFYSTADYVFYLTLYSCKSRKYGIKVSGFSIMPNHVHSQERAESEAIMVKFHAETESVFAREYNDQHHRWGRLFKKSIEYAPKTVGKKIRENSVYIANNAVVGKLVDNVEDYRWSLLAYKKSKHPFSDVLWLKKASSRMRSAVGMVGSYRKRELPLDYKRQKLLFKGLIETERQQLLDYIICSYNFLDYTSLSEPFGDGSFDSALTVMKCNAGSENDIPDDYDDYSAYGRMNHLMRDAGYDVRICNFEFMTSDEKGRLIRHLFSKGFTAKQIRKYLHIPQEK